MMFSSASRVVSDCGGLGLQRSEQALEPRAHVDLLATDADTARGVADRAPDRSAVDLGPQDVVTEGDLDRP